MSNYIWGSDLWTDEQLGRLYLTYGRENPGWYEELSTSAKTKLQTWYSTLSEQQKTEYFPGKQPEEPLWAESEQVPFVKRTGGEVPLSATTFAAGATSGQTVIREPTAANGAGLLLLALLAFWMWG